ncbi:hypothetical protein M427DRAFT_40157 [Gonapodya prolifera JEL478]|uniref:Uncharacterized protein n=1 Tax=Gonapodya prolifera (strain JEL478) TaxID=1344416 RepID=A0A139AZM9_GONPJ|nr:hypothetical protein M427DRAFT_40157 [Gonapodya prolifera JEL478]|eukprot:KXS22179.1 hypothetical protein M427DRAFT_40157 [Gonapodya prolifera JEL478]
MTPLMFILAVVVHLATSSFASPISCNDGKESVEMKEENGREWLPVAFAGAEGCVALLVFVIESKPNESPKLERGNKGFEKNPQQQKEKEKTAAHLCQMHLRLGLETVDGVCKHANWSQQTQGPSMITGKWPPAMSILQLEPLFNNKLSSKGHNIGLQEKGAYYCNMWITRICNVMADSVVPHQPQGVGYNKGSMMEQKGIADCQLMKQRAYHPNLADCPGTKLELIFFYWNLVGMAYTIPLFKTVHWELEPCPFLVGERVTEWDLLDLHKYSLEVAAFWQKGPAAIEDGGTMFIYLNGKHLQIKMEACTQFSGIHTIQEGQYQSIWDWKNNFQMI